MSQDDRLRWNARYRTAQREKDISHVMEHAQPRLQSHGRALDVAGGLGRHAFWLAARGLTVTLLDVSDEAVAQVNRAAVEENAAVTAVVWDGEQEPLPNGNWDVVVCTQYLQRGLFAQFAHVVAPGGILVFSQPTVENLTRHPHPSARFLLQPGELPTLLVGFTPLYSAEGWTPHGTHEASVVAQRA